MASASFLEITYSFASTSDNEANGSIWDHDLDTIFSFPESGLMASFCACPTTTASGLRFSRWVTPVLFNDSVYFPLCINACPWITSNLTLPLRPTRFRACNKLNSRSCVFFNSTQILALSSDDQADKRGVN